jgi:hypothetical protein
MNGVAQVGNMSAIVTLDYDGRLWYFSQTISDTGWNKNPVSAEVKFNSAPSIAQVGDSAVIAVAGPDGALWFYQQAISTLPNGVWNLTPALSDPGSLSQVPSVAQVGDSAVIALVDNFGTLWSYQKKINTEIWSPPQQVVSSGSTAFALQSPSVAQVGDSAVIAAVDTSGGLRFYWQTIGTTPWNPELVDGPTTGSGRILAYPSVAQVGDSAVIIAVDNTSSLWSYWQTIGTKPWNPDSVLQTEPEAPFLTLPYPSVAQVGDSAVIAAANSDPAVSLWFYWQASSGGGWTPEGVPSGTILASPSVAQVGNSSVITASDNWGNLWYFWQTIGTAEWHQEPVASHESLGG